MKYKILLLLAAFAGSINRGHSQFVKGVHSNVKTQGKVLAIIAKDLYKQTSGAVDTVIFITTFNNKGECTREDESRVYDSRYPALVDSSKVQYRSWHTYYLYHYNSESRLLNITWSRDSTKGVIYFDKKSLPVKEEELSPNGYRIEKRKRYDDSGNVKQQFTYANNDFVVKHLYKYNNKNLEIEYSQETKYSHSNVTYFEYQSFDKMGNWTKVISYNKDHKQFNESIREIKYAE